MPVVIIVLYIIVAQAAFSWNLHEMYGDVHKNGDMWVLYVRNIIAIHQFRFRNTAVLTDYRLIWLRVSLVYE
jgi:hypothetical protein